MIIDTDKIWKEIEKFSNEDSLKEQCYSDIVHSIEQMAKRFNAEIT